MHTSNQLRNHIALSLVLFFSYTTYTHASSRARQYNTSDSNHLNTAPNINNELLKILTIAAIILLVFCGLSFIHSVCQYFGLDTNTTPNRYPPLINRTRSQSNPQSAKHTTSASRIKQSTYSYTTILALSLSCCSSNTSA